MSEDLVRVTDADKKPVSHLNNLFHESPVTHMLTCMCLATFTLVLDLLTFPAWFLHAFYLVVEDGWGGLMNAVLYVFVYNEVSEI